jgi:Zn-dependent metalloprotease
MKKITLSLVFVAFVQVLSAQSSKLSLYAQELLLDEQMRPNFLKLKESYQMPEKDAVEFMTALLFADNGSDLQLIRSEQDDLGFTHNRYQVRFNQVPVSGKVIVAHFREHKLVSLNGELFAFEGAKNGFGLTAEAALAAALKHVNATKYKWESKDEEAHMAKALNDPNFSYSPKAEKVLIEKNGQLFAAYKFNIYAEVPLYRADVFVNASTGKVITENNQICTVNTPGTAATKYSGTQTIVCDFNGSTNTLKETTRGLGVETYSLSNTTTYTNVNFNSASSTWTLSTFDQGALDAHWGAEKTYDYYWTQHNRNSVNNAGYKLISYVHYSTNYQNAFWDGQRMTYGDGGGTYKIFTALDICGHEVSHGMTSNTSNLNYSNESGALNESYSDIFGTCIENYARPTNWNWKIGEDIMNSAAGLRNMSNPNLFGDPDTYGGTNWYTGTADNGGVHTNSGVSNFWFYLLTAGGSGTNDLANTYSVSGLGFTSASRIAFRALTVYYTSTTNFATARNLSIQAAKDLFGDCSNEMIQTMNAWHAVGVGNKYVPGVVGANFNAGFTNFCTLPVTINFTNLTPYASQYQWNFGDGGIATTTNAIHTYTAGGNYTVKLKAIGCSNAADSMTKASYIQINIPPIPVTSSVVACANSAVTLSANGTNTLKWYDSPSSTNLIGTGSVITTPAVSSPTTFYVSNAIPNASSFGGMLTNTGGGYLANSAQWLVFDVVQSGTLNSVVVYASTVGTRTVELRNSANVVINSVPFTLAVGANTLTLYFPLTVGTNYRLALGNGTSNLYRSNSGVSYPYSVGGCLNITNSSAGAASYYWFYNWEVTKADCESPLVPVNVGITQAPAVSMNALAQIVCKEDQISLVGQPAGGSFSGPGVTGNTFAGTTLGAGTYTISYTYTDITGCSGTDSKVVNASDCEGLKETKALGLRVYPNPVSTSMSIVSENKIALQYTIMDVTGRVIMTSVSANSNHVLDLQGLSGGVYVLSILDEKGILVDTQKLVKE